MESMREVHLLEANGGVMMTVNGRKRLKSFTLIALIFIAALAYRLPQGRAQIGGSASTPIAFSGGHDTEPRDHGRPVILVASALAVPPEVFRDAFSHVHPAPQGTQPSPDEQRQNKAALLSRLAPYGVTNERLDEVSDHYRRPDSGELWPTRPAKGYAVVIHGAISSFVVTDGGEGYTTSPTVTVPAYPAANGTAILSFSADFDKNGTVTRVLLPVHR